MEVKALLEELGLRGWPKTSGSRGMHVNVRIEQRWTFTEVRRAALAFSREIERRMPRLATSKWWKEERHGVFLDYNQNAKDRTTCSAYSVRPLPDARVSAPLAWEEVPDCDPADFTVPDHAGAIRRDRRSACRHGCRRGLAGERCSSSPRGTRPRHAATRPGRRNFARWRARHRGSRRRARSGRRRSRATKMPLIVVANSPDKEAALAGLERWKQAHPEAARHLAVDDVLVDSMRGRSSTWTRIRVNLRNVPEAIRPPQETPDPDDDPTREWREKIAQTLTARSLAGRNSVSLFRPTLGLTRQLAKIAASSCGGTTSSWAKVQSRGLLVGAPAAELRRVPEAGALHVIVGDFDHELAAGAAPTKGPCPGSSGSTAPGRRCRPASPLSAIAQAFHGWSFRSVDAIRREELDQLAPLRVGEACADADMLEVAGIVVEAEQQRADGRALAVLVPAEAGDDAVAFALVLDLEHDPLVGLVEPRCLLGDDAVEAGALEAPEPVGRGGDGRASPA